MNESTFVCRMGQTGLVRRHPHLLAMMLASMSATVTMAREAAIFASDQANMTALAAQLHPPINAAPRLVGCLGETSTEAAPDVKPNAKMEQRMRVSSRYVFKSPKTTGGMRSDAGGGMESSASLSPTGFSRFGDFSSTIMHRRALMHSLGRPGTRRDEGPTSAGRATSTRSASIAVATQQVAIIIPFQGRQLTVFAKFGALFWCALGHAILSSRCPV